MVYTDPCDVCAPYVLQAIYSKMEEHSKAGDLLGWLAITRWKAMQLLRSHHRVGSDILEKLQPVAESLPPGHRWTIPQLVDATNPRERQRALMRRWPRLAQVAAAELLDTFGQVATASKTCGNWILVGMYVML